LIVWLPLICIMTLGPLRPFKATLIALQFHSSAQRLVMARCEGTSMRSWPTGQDAGAPVAAARA
jgi:hypothetical protein